MKHWKWRMRSFRKNLGEDEDNNTKDLKILMFVSPQKY